MSKTRTTLQTAERLRQIVFRSYVGECVVNIELLSLCNFAVQMCNGCADGAQLMRKFSNGQHILFPMDNFILEIPQCVIGHSQDLVLHYL